jgi:hypothetical protein
VVALLVINAFDRIWKEVTWSNLGYSFGIFVEGQRIKKLTYSMEQSPNRLSASQETPRIL